LFAVGGPVEISYESEGAVGLLEGVGDIYIYMGAPFEVFRESRSHL